MSLLYDLVVIGRGHAGAARGGQGISAVVFPDGEAVTGFLQRTQNTLAEIIASHKDSALIVAHGVQTMVALGMWFEPDLTKWPSSAWTIALSRKLRFNQRRGWCI